MGGVTYLCTLAPPIPIFTPSFYVLKTILKKLQKETSIDAHLLSLGLAPCNSLRYELSLGLMLGLGLLLGLGFIGLGPHLLKRLIGRTSNVLALVHSFY